MKKFIIVFFLSILAVSSCKKSDTETIKNVEAKITFTGSVAADGCGYLVKINASGTSYHANNLPDNYQKDNLPVLISYRLLSTKFSCGLLSNNIPEIELDAITNK